MQPATSSASTVEDGARRDRRRRARGDRRGGRGQPRPPGRQRRFKGDHPRGRARRRGPGGPWTPLPAVRRTNKDHGLGSALGSDATVEERITHGVRPASQVRTGRPARQIRRGGAPTLHLSRPLLASGSPALDARRCGPASGGSLATRCVPGPCPGRRRPRGPLGKLSSSCTDRRLGEVRPCYFQPLRASWNPGGAGKKNGVVRTCAGVRGSSRTNTPVAPLASSLAVPR